jgi:hypothetical protein
MNVEYKAKIGDNIRIVKVHELSKNFYNVGDEFVVHAQHYYSNAISTVVGVYVNVNQCSLFVNEDEYELIK